MLQPLLIAVFLFFAIRPAADLLNRFAIPYWLGYTLLLAGVLAVFFILGHFLQGTALSFREHWPEYRQRFADLIDSVVPGEGRAVINTLTLSGEELVKILFGTALNVLEFVLMTFFYVMFLILDVGKMTHRVQRAFVSGESRSHRRGGPQDRRSNRLLR